MSLPFDKALVCTDAVLRGRDEVEPIKCIVVLQAPGNQYHCAGIPLGAAGNFIKSVMKLGAMTIALNESHQPQPHLGNIAWLQPLWSYSIIFLPFAIIY